MKKIKNFAVGATGSMAAFLITSVNAATAPAATITSVSDVTSLLCHALNWVYWGLVVVGVGMFLVGGYLYATSSGDAEKVGKANKTLLYAAIAIVVALVAGGVPIFLGSIFGVSSSSLNVCSGV